MRCPKCGYTSFDDLERCKKCKKNIAATATALMGTVASAAIPSFLGAAQPPQEQNQGPDTGIELNIDDDSSLDFSSGTDDLFSLDEGTPGADIQPATPELAEDRGIDLRLSDDLGADPSPQEAAIDMELDLSLDDLGETPLNLGNTEAADTPASPGLDLAGLDISDLQAPEAPASQEIAFEPSLRLDDEPAPVSSAAAGAAPADDEFSLEDLQVEGLAESKPGAPVADDQYQPGMKTGTALDNFNFELDELLELNENEKA